MPKKSTTAPSQWWPLSAHEARAVKPITTNTESWGKKLAQKNEIKKKSSVERKEFSFLFIGQLNTALIIRAHEEQTFWYAGIMLPTLAKHVRTFHGKVIKLLDQTLLHKSSGAPPTLRNAKSMRLLVTEFKKKCSQYITNEDVGQFQLAICLNDLCDDIEHFVVQIQIVFGIVSVVGQKPVVANRPTKSDAKNLYCEIVNGHQAKYGPNHFPKPREAQAALSAGGYAVSKRTLNNWKSQVNKNLIGFFIQPKKRQ